MLVHQRVNIIEKTSSISSMAQLQPPIRSYADAKLRAAQGQAMNG